MGAVQLDLFDTFELPEPDADLRRLWDTVCVNVARQRTAPGDIIYVGRTFGGWVDIGFGNPFPISSDTVRGRAEVLVTYTRWLDSDNERARAVRGGLSALAGNRLGCWCWPKLCHAQVLAGYANGYGTITRHWVAELEQSATNAP